MTTASDRINGIIRHTNATRYLEIGVDAGETFFSVDAPFKVAVDPAFQFDPAQYQSGGVFFFSTPSDAFFEEFAASSAATFLLENYAELVFDLIYIDGLHTFAQSYRDFLNSLRFAHEKTVWIIDDTVPNDPYSSLPDLEDCRKYKRLAAVGSESWHGDVYKTVVALHDAHKDFFFRTLLTDGHPQTVTWKASGQVSTRDTLCPYFDVIDQLDYFAMAKNAHTLHIGGAEDLLDILHTVTDAGLQGEDASTAFFYTPVSSVNAAYLLKENKSLERQNSVLRKELARRATDGT